MIVKNNVFYFILHDKYRMKKKTKKRKEKKKRKRFISIFYLKKFVEDCPMLFLNDIVDKDSFH
jgi:hypothetical protein